MMDKQNRISGSSVMVFIVFLVGLTTLKMIGIIEQDLLREQDVQIFIAVFIATALAGVILGQIRT